MTMLRMLAAVLAAAFALAAGPAQAEMKTQWVEYTHGDVKLKAYMAYDDKVTGRRPAVLMIHAREGMTPKTQQLAEIWAKLGYVSFAADIFGYGQGVLPKDVAEMQAQTAIYTKDRPLMRARTQAGYRRADQEPDGRPVEDRADRLLLRRRGRRRVRLDRRAARRERLDPRLVPRPRAGWAKNAKGMFLILHGAEDEGYPLTTVDQVIQELRGAKVPFQLEIYSGTGHGFSTPKNKAEERANAQSIASTARTLKELFGI